ncbi:LOW QUALITY PROTEIN: uncharacterized protein EMH_0087940 [Eimeria mitis]|uniref:Peptidase A2 domain-containing protein n=1 Tax=Eimeria mitis TaxID=44415 RepID=U6KEP9_9EIME|nr:LOW QUALITY PROTEIN: uncharacterized protein EMH_0087940 [Eimeria mitis]CDJ36500.1 hypothetical protein EMH_0087940 [Eimeria mitis]
MLMNGNGEPPNGNGIGTDESERGELSEEAGALVGEEMILPSWLWEQDGRANPHGTLCRVCSGGRTAVLQLEITGYRCEGLLDTGASRSFIQPTVVERLGLRTRALSEEYFFTVANGENIKIHREVPRLAIICGGECFTGNFLVGQVPYAVILGIDWLDRYKVAWFFGSDKLRTYVKGKVCDLPVLRKEGERPTEITGKGDTGAIYLCYERREKDPRKLRERVIQSKPRRIWHMRSWRSR